MKKMLFRSIEDCGNRSMAMTDSDLVRFLGAQCSFYDQGK
jgi:hypothetical protein